MSPGKKKKKTKAETVHLMVWRQSAIVQLVGTESKEMADRNGGQATKEKEKKTKKSKSETSPSILKVGWGEKKRKRL